MGLTRPPKASGLCYQLSRAFGRWWAILDLLAAAEGTSWSAFAPAALDSARSAGVSFRGRPSPRPQVAL